jgi:hypothetical protein
MLADGAMTTWRYATSHVAMFNETVRVSVTGAYAARPRAIVVARHMITNDKRHKTIQHA